MSAQNQKDKFSLQGEKTFAGDAAKQQYCEIHLISGSIIIAETWWEQNDMIMYKTKHGVMSIEKKSVEIILSK